MLIGKITQFFLAPVLSLFSMRFYRRILKSSLAFGFLYLFYLSLIGAFTFALAVNLKILPFMDDFASWFSQGFPALTIKGGVITSPVDQPYRMVHPDFGTVFILDTAKEKLKEEEASTSLLYATKTRVYLWNPAQNETQVFDLSEPAEPGKQNQAVSEKTNITGQLIQRYYAKVRRIGLFAVFVLMAVFIFIWKLGAAMLYSLIALLLNRFRDEKFSYPALLNISMLALTPVAVIQFLGFIDSHLRMTVHLLIAVVITVFYLVLALFIASPPDLVPGEVRRT